MAGNFPDAPAQRIAYDRDGSVGFLLDGGVINELNNTEMQRLNDEAALSGLGDNTTRKYGVVFPEPRDVVGVYWASASASSGDEPVRSVETSPDTTNGIDGTWTTVIAGTPTQTYGTAVAPDYRNLIQAVTWNGVKAVRWTAGRVQYAFHAYGGPSASSPFHDRLRLWEPSADLPLGGATLDFGNAPRHSSADKRFRIKNASPTKTATGIAVITETLTDTTPSVLPQLLLSSDGVRFTQTLALGSIVPNGFSNLLYIRRITPPDAQLGLAAFCIVATAASFT